MELSKALLGAILVGVTVTSSCTKDNNQAVQPGTEQNSDAMGNNPNAPHPEDCPACGMG